MSTNQTLTVEVRCAYPGKQCNRPRSLKRDGRLHRFCIYHRERANLVQRRVDARRRLHGHDHEKELTEKEFNEVKRRELELERQRSEGVWLDEKELEYLAQVLFDTSDHDSDG